MFPRLLVVIGLIFCPLLAVAADAPAAPADEAPAVFETTGIELYLPKDVMNQRALNDDLATYTKALQAAAEDYFAAQKTPAKEDLDIVAAVKPGPQARVWLVSRVLPEADDRLADLRDKLAAVPPPPVSGGAVAFCIHGEVAGGNGQPPSKPGSPPFPKEWSDDLARAGLSAATPFDPMMALVASAPPAGIWDSPDKVAFWVGILAGAAAVWGCFYWRKRKAKGS